VTTRIRVELAGRGYDVVVGVDASAELGALLAGRARVAVVTQQLIADAHGDRVRGPLAEAGIAHELFTIDDGEDAKSLATVERLSGELARWGLKRSDALIAFGGGVVGDTAGFTAAIYYRGVDVVQVPTTLLAMVDAAIGGKTGVNLDEGKNLVGAFHQPLAVLCDPTVLATLPEREYRSGLGEVVKYAMLGDDALTALIEERNADLLARKPEVLTDVIARCATTKAAVVAADELEQTGVRATLNLGHTVAHALETAAGYGLLHGEAVAVGLVFAAQLAAGLERIPTRAADRAVGLLRALDLPTRAPEGLRADELLAIMGRDKKSGGALTFVLDGPNGIERVVDPDPAAVRKAFAAIGVEV
jgi:3-dehydroquinate synthase